MRANVLLPTATLPAMPMMYGTFGVDVPEELPRHLVQLLRRRHVQVQQPGERQVDGGNLVELDALVDAAQRVEILRAQRQRGRGAEVCPLVAPEGEIAACRVGHGLGPYARAMPVSQRKLLGAWYTPPELVDAVVAEVLRDFTPRTVLDPACGDGRFLAPFADTATVTGIDIDPTTSWTHGDSLSMDWGDQRFDAVVGNPPFLNQLASSTSRGGRSKFGGGPYADSAAEFLSLAIRLARPGGRVGLVLPLSMLSTRDVDRDPRRGDSDRAALRWMWWSHDPDVRSQRARVGGSVGGRRRRRAKCGASFGPEFEPRPAIAMPAQWSGLIADTIEATHDGPVLGDIATFTADFRDQYYGLIGAVSDSAVGPPLVTSGLIEPNECWWGRRQVRFAKQKFSAPRVDVSLLSPALQRWAGQRLVPKILIANQTRRIEAVIDREGAWLPSVPVITCTTDRLDDVAAVLHSDAATEWVRYHAAGSGLECHVRAPHRATAGIDPAARSHGRDSQRRQLTKARIVIHDSCAPHSPARPSWG